MGPRQQRDLALAPRRPRHLHSPEDSWRQLQGTRQVDEVGRRGPHPRRNGSGQAGRRPAHHRRLLRHASAGQRHRRRGERSLLRPAVGIHACGHAGRVGRYPRRPNASIGALSRRGCRAAIRRWHHRAPHGNRGRGRGEPVRAGGDDQGTQRGPRLLPRRARHPEEGSIPQPRTGHALATWGDITFNYESTDTPDVVATPTVN